MSNLQVKIEVPSAPVHNVEFRLGQQKYCWRQRHSFRVVRRHEFDHALAKAAVNRGLQLRQGEAFRNFERLDDKLRVESSRGEYKVRALVGADGALSIVRRKMGPAEKSRLSRLIAILTPADAQQAPGFVDNTAIFDFGPTADGLQGYVWDFPCLENGAAMINRGIFDSRVHPNRPRVDLKAIFSRELRVRNTYQDPKSWASHPERWFSIEGILVQPNVLLVGDAAGIGPAFGEGISQALLYGDVAAAALARAFEHNDFSFNNYKLYLMLHPLGQALYLQTQLAKEMYTGGPIVLDKIRKLFAESGYIEKETT